VEGEGGRERERKRVRKKEKERERERDVESARGCEITVLIFLFFLFAFTSQTYRQTLDTFLKDSTIKKKTGVQADARGVPERVRSRDARNLHYPNPPGQSDLVL
jgi:hypothetical protein